MTHFKPELSERWQSPIILSLHRSTIYTDIEEASRWRVGEWRLQLKIMLKTQNTFEWGIRFKNLQWAPIYKNQMGKNKSECSSLRGTVFKKFLPHCFFQEECAFFEWIDLIWRGNYLPYLNNNYFKEENNIIAFIGYL